MDSAKAYWDKQTTSLHRSGQDEFYRSKAEEHASLIPVEERQVGCIDLGCGAGELLYFFSDVVRVDTGLDYSESMLKNAKEKLSGKKIELIHGDIFQYLPKSRHPIWTTTGALNQYLDPEQLNAFLDLFTGNAAARSLYLFDCVDPIRHLLMPYGISYRTPVPRGPAKQIYHFARRGLIGAGLALGILGQPSRKLRGAGMGYGYLPKFWLAAAARRGLECEIVGSRAYEYRFHVAMRKPS